MRRETTAALKRRTRSGDAGLLVGVDRSFGRHALASRNSEPVPMDRALVPGGNKRVKPAGLSTGHRIPTSISSGILRCAPSPNIAVPIRILRARQLHGSPHDARRGQGFQRIRRTVIADRACLRQLVQGAAVSHVAGVWTSSVPAPVAGSSHRSYTHAGCSAPHSGRAG